MHLDLSAVDTPFIDDALIAWRDGDIRGILCFMSNTRGLAFVLNNIRPLRKKGLYEKALFDAYIRTRTNWSYWSPSSIEFMFGVADPEKLAQAGDPLPNHESFTLYRGVGGIGRARRVSGHSWTSSLDTAIWFAKRAKSFGLNDPAVFTVTVHRKSIMACSNKRNEQEYFLKLPLPVRPKRIRDISLEDEE